MKSQGVSKRARNKDSAASTSRPKVFVGMSGGVDSSVSAALLKRSGYDVTGVFIKVWQPDWIECTWREERRDAMRVAAALEIPFITLDLEKEYKKDVIDYMIAEYAAGRTPNPDVMCNRYVKFGAFWKWAEKNGADFIATGHYARITEQGVRSKEKGEANRLLTPNFLLLKGRDSNKDQSYFLWTLNQNDLAHILFPVGGKTKPEVRKLAHRFKLPVADKKDSQGLCFIGKVDIKEFLSHYIKGEPGNVLDEAGETIGRHSGALLFTIGERHGFTVTKKTPNDAPYYVVDKDVEQNTITVSNRSSRGSLTSASKEARVKNMNWISGSVPMNSTKLLARARYRQPLEKVKISSTGITETKIEFAKPQDALTPGQSLVFYSGQACLGGGVIE